MYEDVSTSSHCMLEATGAASHTLYMLCFEESLGCGPVLALYGLLKLGARVQ